MPEISLPDIKLPDVKFRDGRLRDLKLPDIDLRDRLPDVDLSKMSLPGPLRDITLPEVSMPDVHLPDVHLPDVRDMKAPKVDLDLSALDPRRIDLSGVDTKRLREMTPFMRPARRPASPLPWVIVAGVGGLFAGWWLATSSVTGPRVRQLTDSLRHRIDQWRRGRSEWDTDEGSDAVWASSEGSMAGGAEGAIVSSGTWSEGTAQDGTSWDSSGSTAAIGGTESVSEAESGYPSSSDAGVGGTGYEPATTGYGSDVTDREG